MSFKLSVHFSTLSKKSSKYHLSSLLWLNCKNFSKLETYFMCLIAFSSRLIATNLSTVSRIRTFSHYFFSSSFFSGFSSSSGGVLLLTGSYLLSNFSTQFLRFLLSLASF
jgi:hypothetical protein